MNMNWFGEIFFAVGFVCIGFTAGCGFGYASGLKAKYEEEQLRLKRDADFERQLKVIVEFFLGGDKKWNSNPKTKETTTSSP